LPSGTLARTNGVSTPRLGFSRIPVRTFWPL